MHRYLVERTFQDGGSLTRVAASQEAFKSILAANARVEATWIHSYVSSDGRKSFCLYDAPSPEAVRRAAGLSGLPLESITEVHTFDPYAVLRK